jgi:hypothetical protein
MDTVTICIVQLYVALHPLDLAWPSASHFANVIYTLSVFSSSHPNASSQHLSLLRHHSYKTDARKAKEYRLGFIRVRIGSVL